MENNSNQPKWYDHKVLTNFLIFFFPPIGLYALWKSNAFAKWWKISATCFIGILFLTMITTDPKEKSTAPIAEKKVEIKKSTITKESKLKNGYNDNKWFGLEDLNIQYKYYIIRKTVTLILSERVDKDLLNEICEIIKEDDPRIRDERYVDFKTFLKDKEEGHWASSHYGKRGYITNIIGFEKDDFLALKAELKIKELCNCCFLDENSDYKDSDFRSSSPSLICIDKNTIENDHIIAKYFNNDGYSSNYILSVIYNKKDSLVLKQDDEIFILKDHKPLIIIKDSYQRVCYNF